MSEDTRKSYAEMINRKRMALLIKTIRRSRGFSESELAEKAGYKTSAIITAIENASTDPGYEKVKDIANALDVSIGQLKGAGKIEISEKGWPKLSESERLALFLFAPIIEVLDDEGINYLIDTSLMICKANSVEPDWGKTEYQRERERKEE